MTSKPLPSRVYPRGDQGTFVYAPDISVFVSTDDYGIVDISHFITSFTLQRNVNSPSNFTCTFDNKFARFDRVLRRMDRIAVFLRRVQWLQVFAGYISVAPWQTIVPGDAMLMAECTLRKLVYTYWDPHSAESQQLYPPVNSSESRSPDGGSAATMFRLLADVSKWDPKQIQIQRIPVQWLNQAAKVLQKSKDQIIADPSVAAVKKYLNELLDAEGWRGSATEAAIQNIEAGSPGGIATASVLRGMGRTLGGSMSPNNGVDQKWFQTVGRRHAEHYPPRFGSTPEYYSGFVNQKYLKRVPGLVDEKGNQVYLRPDAASSLIGSSAGQGLLKAIGSNGTIRVGYLSFEQQKETINNTLKKNKGNIQKTCGEVSCPAGFNEHGWATAIDFPSGQSPSAQTMNNYGWMNDPTGDGGVENPDHWVFVGNFSGGWPAYISQHNPYTAPSVHGGRGSGPPSNQYNWDNPPPDASNDPSGSGTNPAFNSAYFMPGVELESEALTGKRAWINDVPLLQSVADFANASMRDFQSAPDGDFVAYFPDRLGVYGKFPVMQVRDIEVIDFKLIVTDRTLVTHYASIGDFTTTDPGQVDPITNALYDSGIVSVEMPEIMQMILGLSKDEVPDGLGRWMLERFGIRPKRDDNYNLFNPGYNFMLALHRFQEAWSAQWQAIVSFTFMPEVYPGMRIELVDKGIAVYVESVTHFGDRSSGFSTQVVISTPMKRVKGEWKMLPMEFNPADFIPHGGASRFAPNDDQPVIQPGPGHLQ